MSIESLPAEHLLGRAVNAGKGARELIPGDRNAGDANPFSGLDQVRGAVKPGPNPASAQARFNHRGNRPLAVGPGDVNVPACPVRIPQLGEQGANPVQAQLDRSDLVAERVQEAN